MHKFDHDESRAAFKKMSRADINITAEIYEIKNPKSYDRAVLVEMIIDAAELCDND